MHLLNFLLATLIIIGCFASVFGQQKANATETEEDEQSPVVDPEEQFKQLFQAVDSDGNGSISGAEALQFWQTKSKTMDPEELRKKLETFNAKTLDEAVERGFKRVDKNGDSAVSPEELKAYLQS